MYALVSEHLHLFLHRRRHTSGYSEKTLPLRVLAYAQLELLVGFTVQLLFLGHETERMPETPLRATPKSHRALSSHCTGDNLHAYHSQ